MPARKSATKGGARKRISQADWNRLRNRLVRDARALGQLEKMLRNVRLDLEKLAATPPGTYPNVTDKPPS